MAEYDAGYKALFSHAEMVADLIRGFVREDWVHQLDFSSLERVPSEFITPRLRRRDSDIIWRLRWGQDRWLYVYLLLEFQSKVDPYMALRLMVYVGLLYQYLIKDRQIPESGTLPPVLPLVLYNGYAPWGAARDVGDLIEEVPGGLEHYQPRLRYCLLDEARLADAELVSLRNLAAALFRLEKSRGPREIRKVLTALVRWLRDPALAELRRAFTLYVKEILLPARVPGAKIPQMKNLEEVRSVLAERVKDWTRDWKQEGMEKGLQKGLQRGLQRGLQKGLRKGLRKGLQEGRREGRREGREEGRQEERERALGKARAALVRELEKRFGPLPEAARRRVESIDSIERIVKLSARASTAPSLAALRLG